ncbi:MAG: DUF4176 domain-containing protein [Bacilli bacterium]|nr:DUF4176 domain-containing protein [Bacilli bacterium]
MNQEKYLPIGSVVLLKNAKKQVMITGFLARSKEENSKVYDYMGCMYPEGILSSEFNLLFNHDQIENIYYIGYSDNNWKELNANIKKSFDESEK